MRLPSWFPHRHGWVGCHCRWCSRTRHDLDRACRCRRCGRLCHDWDICLKWIDEEGLDADTGWPWEAYDQVEYEVAYCRRCGVEFGRDATGMVRNLRGY